jgi:hypothetical protein
VTWAAGRRSVRRFQAHPAQFGQVLDNRMGPAELARLGFHCCRIGHRPDGVDQGDLSPADRRLSAVEAALAAAQKAIAPSSSQAPIPR